MKATLVGISNAEDIESAKRLGYDEPKAILKDTEDIFFLMDAVEAVHKDIEGTMIVQLNGILYRFKYEIGLYNEISDMLV